MSLESGANASGVTLAQGHVFLAHGRIEYVGHDAAVVPTDRFFSVRPYWEPLLGGPAERFRPPDWPREYAKSPGHPNLWFIDVGDAPDLGAADLVARAVRLLDEIAANDLSPGPGRTTLRVAMPVIGIAGGGIGSQRGDVILALQSGLGQAANRLGIDIVLVTPDAAVFSAAQHQRRQQDQWPLTDELSRHARQLGTLSREGHLALFLGAGVSVPAGLPTWGGLLAELTENAGLTTTAGFEELSALDQAQLLEKSMGDSLGDKVASIASRSERPSLAHALLAGLGCQQVVTTNYDQLYEAAVAATGQPTTTVLPWNDVGPGQPWVLKMHGDIEHPSSIVLTRRHFVRFDARGRPAGSLLQSLLLTKHLLIVGASLNDYNVARLADEVEHFRRDHKLADKFGTLLDVDGISARRELWSDQLHWIDMPGDQVHERARSLEIFLDAVAAYASADSSWLLDARFAALLSAEERDAAEEARTLYEHVIRLKDFAPLTRSLEDLGTNGGHRGELEPEPAPTEPNRHRHR